MRGGSDAPLVSVVVPVFNEEEGLPELQRRIEEALGGIDGGHEVVYVDDGSTDGSAALLEALALSRDDILLVRLSRNFGMEIAMSAGMDHARGEYVALLHADLQDPPELIPEMLVRAGNGADVVYARRIGRDESFLKRTLATAFYRLMERLARTPYQGQAGDFRLMSRRVVDAVCAMPERRRFLRGMVAWVGYEQVPIEYRRAGRHAGRGASYPALIRLALEAIASFSDVPLRLASYLGVALSLLSVLLATVVLGLALVGAVVASTEAWILIAVLFLGGAQLVSAGIIGRYLARVHDQSLGRPLYLVDRVVAVHGPPTVVPAAAAVSGER
ncbi:MAG TPA: glycosyltransferase family 2 protein [Conexibacter sp.]|nr:glycosyltransferase family 2 protein [Conexibacter sp.]